MTARSLYSTSAVSYTDTAPTDIYTLSLHDALPISQKKWFSRRPGYHALARPYYVVWRLQLPRSPTSPCPPREERSEEHTSELQSHSDLVCRLLLEKKNAHETGQKTAFLEQVDRCDV